MRDCSLGVELIYLRDKPTTKQMTQPIYTNGSTVIYKESTFTIVDNYYKNYSNQKGWFYNLNDRGCQAIPEAQLKLA